MQELGEIPDHIKIAETQGFDDEEGNGDMFGNDDDDDSDDGAEESKKEINIDDI